MLPINTSSISIQFNDSLILICGGRDTKNSKSQDIIFFNQMFLTMKKLDSVQLSVSDSFTGTE